MRSDSSVQRRYLTEQVGSIALVSLYADGFEQLDCKQRLLSYYLARVGMAADEIYTDKVSGYGIRLASLLNHIVPHLGDVEPNLSKKMADYAKLVWMNHGNYDLESCWKFTPEFTFEQLEEVALKDDSWCSGRELRRS